MIPVCITDWQPKKIKQDVLKCDPEDNDIDLVLT